MQLKDILMEPDADYREQLDEMCSGFPKVKKALKLEESDSDWQNSNLLLGQNESTLGNDEEAHQ